MDEAFPTVAVPLTLAVDDLIFADGFESGTLDAWSPSSPTDGGDLSVSAAAALGGSADGLRRLGGVYALMGRARLDDNSQADTGFFTVTGEPHAVEFDLVAASGPDALDNVRAVDRRRVADQADGPRQQPGTGGLRPHGSAQREDGRRRYVVLGRVRIAAVHLHRPAAQSVWPGSRRATLWERNHGA